MNRRMYKVLLADDEYWTREKIRRMIPWEEYALEFLEPAQDGEEVLQILEEHMPDILITDINMPFLNGVDLLKTVQERYPDMVTFVISGYDDFEYVKGTFMAGAINYLIKPITKIDLVNAVSKALEIISERENEKEELQKAGSIIQDREFSQLLERKDTPFIPTITVNSGMDLAGMSLMLIKIHDLKGFLRGSGQDISMFSCRMKKEIRAILGHEEAIVFNYVYRFNEFIVVSELVEKELIKAAGQIREYLSSLSGSPVTICISGHSYSMESIHMAYVEAIGLLMTRSFVREDEILCPGKKGEEGKVRPFFNGACEKQLRHALEKEDKEAVRRAVYEQTGLSDCSRKGWSYLEVRQTVRQILTVLTDYAIGGTPGIRPGDMENLTESMDKVVEQLDSRTLCDMMGDVIDLLLPEKQESATDSMKDIVRRAARWIDTHYFEELSLSLLAAHYHVESSYFSRCFRQEIGESLILYITRKRMEKAVEYMKDSEINLTEIAFMVGYDDYTYFSRVFRKNLGMSPREYRSRCREEKG